MYMYNNLKLKIIKMSKVHLSKPLDKFSGNMFADYEKMDPYMFTLGFKLRKIDKSLQSIVEIRSALANKVIPAFQNDFQLFQPFLITELNKYIEHEDSYYKLDKNSNKKYFLSAFVFSALSLYASHRFPGLISKNAVNLVFGSVGLYLISDFKTSKRKYENEDLIIGASRVHGVLNNINTI